MTVSKQILLVQLAVLSICTTIKFAAAQSSAEQSDFSSEKQLKTEISKLQKKETRKDSLFRLINFAATELFPSGSVFYLSDHEDWVKMAAAAVNKLAKNDEALTLCLEEGDHTSKLWAIRNVAGNPKFIKALESIAEFDTDSSVRKQALKALPKADSARLTTRLKKTPPKDPYVLESLFEDEASFNTQLAAVLQSANGESRIQILNFIGSDGLLGLNPTPKHAFSSEVFNAVIRSCKAENIKERAAAAYALDRLKKFDPAESKKVFLELSRDSEPDVRWRAAKALSNQRGDKAVDEMFGRLQQDESSLVRSMTTNFATENKQTPEELAKSSNEIEKLDKDNPAKDAPNDGTPDKDIQTKTSDKPTQVVPVNSAAAAAWIGRKDVPAQFLLPDPPRPNASKRSTVEQTQEFISFINKYIDEIKAEQPDKSYELKRSLEARMASASEESHFAEIRKLINQTKGNENTPDLYVVNVVSEDWPRTDNVYTRSVHLTKTGAPVVLALMAGDQEGTQWTLTVDEGVELKKIILSGNGVRNSTVAGNFPKSIPVLSKENDDSTFTVWVPDEQNFELTNRREAFFSSHFGLSPTTIQNRKDKGHQPRATIVVGNSESDWCESLTKELLKPLYLEAKDYENNKFASSFEYEFPMLIATPVHETWNSSLAFNTGWCTHLKGTLKTPINKISPLHAFEYAGLTYDPNSETYFFATRKQAYIIDATGDCTPIFSDEQAKEFEKDTLRGIVVDTRRNRLLLSSGKKTFAYDLSLKKLTELNFNRYSSNLACYDANDDILYARDGNVVFRINPEDGSLLSQGYLPISSNEILKEMHSDGNNFVFTSSGFATAGGAKQIATVIDKRDGSIMYQSDCVFTPIKTDQNTVK